MGVIEELRDVVALPDYMNDSLIGFAHRVALALKAEQERPNPDNYLIAILADAGRLAWELAQHPRVFRLEEALEAMLSAFDFGVEHGESEKAARDKAKAALGEGE